MSHLGSHFARKSHGSPAGPGDKLFNAWQELAVQNAMHALATELRTSSPGTPPATTPPTPEKFLDTCEEYAHQTAVTEYGENSIWERKLLECIRGGLGRKKAFTELMKDPPSFERRFASELALFSREFALANNASTLSNADGMKSYDFMFTDLNAATGTLRPDVRRVIEDFATRCLKSYWVQQPLQGASTAQFGR